jgi:hypothetical protein
VIKINIFLHGRNRGHGHAPSSFDTPLVWRLKWVSRVLSIVPSGRSHQSPGSHIMDASSMIRVAKLQALLCLTNYSMSIR